MKLVNKIYQVTPYYPPSLGGMQKCVKNITDQLVKRNYKVTVITSNIGTKSSSVSNENLEVKYLNSIEFANTPISLKFILELLRIPREAVVHLHIANALLPELVWIISKIKGFSYISHIHIDVQASSFIGKLLPYYKAIFLKRVIRNSKFVIVLTKSFQKLIQINYGIEKSKIIIIPNGVDKKFFLNPYFKKKNKYNILFVGRLSHQKNIPLLISAFSKIKSKAILHIVGEGNLGEYLVNMIKDNNIKNIELHGRKNENELIDFYKMADIFVLPSLNEGMSLSLLEAMAAGLPIIASYTPENHELLGKGAKLINKNSIEEYAYFIDKLLVDFEERKLMSKINIQTAKEFSWENTITRITNIYENWQ